MDKKQNLPEALLNFFPIVLAFLMPVFYLPTTSEFFEFNKLTLLTLSVVVLLLAWVVKMFLASKVMVAKSLLDAPLLAFTGAFLLSTIFSLNKTSSVFGSYGRWFPSLTGVLSLVAFFYAVSSNIDSKKIIKTAVYALLAGSTVSTAVALLSYFGISIGSSPYLKIQNFTMAGSTSTVAILAALAVVMSLTFLANSKNTLAPVKLLLIQTALVNFFAVALFQNFASWAVLLSGLLGFMFYTNVDKIKESKAWFVPAFGGFAAIVAVLLIPVSRQVIVNKNYPMEAMLGTKESWIVVSSTIRDFPILGSGPSTFYLNYPRYKSLAANSTNTWNVRFDKPSNELFNIVGSMGILGTVVALFFAVKILRFIVNGKQHVDEDGLNSAIFSGILALLVSFTFSYANVLTAFVFFLLLGLAVADGALDNNNKAAERILLSLSSLSSMSLIGGTKETFHYIAAIPMILSAVGGSFYTYKAYAAEYYTRKAIEAASVNNGSLTYQMQGMALNAFPTRDVYHSAYAQTNFALANSISSKEKLTDDDKNSIQVLVSQSIRSTRVATEVLNPLNVSNWETRAAIYRALIGAADNSDQWAISAYNTAIQLDPTNPRLRIDLGGVYYSKQDFLSAANLFRQATSLKDDYANAHYNFAVALRELKSYTDAQRELEIVQRLIPQDSQDYKIVAAEIEAIQAMPEVAGAQSSKPTVEELEGAKAQTEQEPLTKPEDQEKLENNVDLKVDTSKESTETNQ